jgi:hypothetical protein
MKSLIQNKIIEWISYNYLQNIKYFTKDGFSRMISADWISEYKLFDYSNDKFGKDNMIINCFKIFKLYQIN